MRARNPMRAAAALAALIAIGSQAGCRHVEAFDADAGEGTDSVPALHLSAVDILIVIDDSISMAQEQAILATDSYSFARALLNPLPTSSVPAVDDLRIAAVTSNMGFSSDGEMNDQYWPYSVPSACAGFGDNGGFRLPEVTSIMLADGVMPCDATAAQCPEGWACEGIGDDGVGTCRTDGNGVIVCPAQGATWIETSTAAPDPDLAARAACLTVQGTDGCGFEQQLAAADAALAREDQADFVRDEALLVVLVVSDEEDCSMQDGAALFAEDEVQGDDGTSVNLACGAHPEHLFPADYYAERLLARKEPGAAVFAAIVGVPYGEQAGAAACEGRGDELGSCLAQEEMQLATYNQGGSFYFSPACERAGVTKATPGRRFVQLAGLFGGDGYVYSICNEDWGPAFEAIGELIGGKLAP